MTRLRIALAALLLQIACRGSGATPAPLPRFGTFDFTARTPLLEVRGSMVVLPDTVIVQPEGGNCRPPASPNPLQTIRYECYGIGQFETFGLSIDRRNPALYSRWTGTYKEQRQRTVCIQYETNAAGQQVCLRSIVEYFDELVSRSGTLRALAQR